MGHFAPSCLLIVLWAGIYCSAPVAHLQKQLKVLHLLENNWMRPPAPYYSPWVDNFTQRVCPDRLSTPLDLERHPVKIVHANNFLGLPCQSGSSIDAHGELVMRPLRGTYPRGGVQRCPHWISMGALRESESYYKSTSPTLLFRGGYNLSSSLHWQSSVPLTFSRAWYRYLRREVPTEQKTQQAIAASFISNCGASERTSILKSLMKLGVEVHNYGRCLQNKKGGPPRFPREKGGWMDMKNEVIKKYKFTISFENSVGRSTYVTEKFYGPLEVGSVPIHLGDPNIHLFSPDPVGNRSVVSVHDFSSVEELAKFLKYVSNNDTAYNELLAWKRKPLEPMFQKTTQLHLTNAHPRLCAIILDHRRSAVGLDAVPTEVQQRANASIAIARRNVSRLLLLKVRDFTRFYFLPLLADRPATYSGVVRAIRAFNTYRDLSRASCIFDALCRSEFQRTCPEKGEAKVVYMRDVWTHRLLTKNEHVMGLSNGAEIEVLFEVDQRNTDPLLKVDNPRYCINPNVDPGPGRPPHYNSTGLF